MKILFLCIAVIVSGCVTNANKESDLKLRKDAYCILERPSHFNSSDRVLIALFFERSSIIDCKNLEKSKNEIYGHSKLLYSCVCRSDAM